MAKKQGVCRLQVLVPVNTCAQFLALCTLTGADLKRGTIVTDHGIVCHIVVERRLRELFEKCASGCGCSLQRVRGIRQASGELCRARIECESSSSHALSDTLAFCLLAEAVLKVATCMPLTNRLEDFTIDVVVPRNIARVFCQCLEECAGAKILEEEE